MVLFIEAMTMTIEVITEHTSNPAHKDPVDGFVL